MVNKAKRRQRIGAFAVAAMLMSGFLLAPLNAPAQQKKVLAPPGNCTPAQHKALQDAVEVAWQLVRSCGPKEDTPQIILEKMDRFRDCINAREKINNVCFEGGDDGHRRAVESLEQGLDFCKKKLEAKRKHQDRCPGG